MDVVTLIGQFGFPIAICVYLLYTRDKIILQNTFALLELKNAINKICDEKEK